MLSKRLMTLGDRREYLRWSSASAHSLKGCQNDRLARLRTGSPSMARSFSTAPRALELAADRCIPCHGRYLGSAVLLWQCDLLDGAMTLASTDEESNYV